MAARSLFIFDQYEEEARIPDRPLGEISDFVVELMPARLMEIQAGTREVNCLAHEVELLIAKPGRHALNRILVDAQGKKLAAFDVKLLEAGIVHSGGTPSQNLVAIVDTLADATDQPPTVTYEDLIFINPPHDRRTFTNGHTGRSEADFYEGHRIIESYMSEAINRFRWAIYFLEEHGSGGVDKANTALQKSLALLRLVLEYVHTIGMDLNKDDFTLFRTYFQTHPIRHLKGASGAFSASIPLIDLFLGGENLTEDHLEYLHQNMLYFPSEGRKEIHRALAMLEQGLTLNSLYQAAGEPVELGETLQELSHTMRVFRAKHYKAVVYQLPKVIICEEVGSSGETGEFLHRRINTNHIG